MRVGFIGLGMMGKNAAANLRRKGFALTVAAHRKREAIEEATGIRLRPVLMTTAALVFAMIPLLIASGPGAASRFSMGVVIASGMTIGTMFTLFVLPCVYTLLAKPDKAPEPT